MEFVYKFPAVKGTQANRDYYISMVPQKLLPKLFPDDTEIVQPENRAQRRINEQRIPEICEYIISNRSNYVFSAISASIDGEFQFVEIENKSIGILEVSMDATFLINDGQHRKAAIEAAMAEDESLGEETISIVFFRDEGLKNSQQMFTDLNKHAVKTSNSLSTLYDSRDELAKATKRVIENVEFFSLYTDKERDILGKNSSKLFTLSNIYKANHRIVRKKTVTNSDTLFLIKYWSCVANNIYEWNELLNRQITKRDLRENYIITLAITINALGRLGNYFYENGSQSMDRILNDLQTINWLRSNKDWRFRVMRENGNVMNNEAAIILTCSKIKEYLNIPLSVDEENKELELKRGME